MGRYFVTGTSGFIGYHLAKRLLADGHEVFGFDGMTPYYSIRLKHARRTELLEAPRFHNTDGLLEDRARLEEAWRAASPECVIHLAAQAGVRYSIENPEAYFSSNLVGSWNILELAKETEIPHLLIASTSSVYGGNPDVPFFENSATSEPLTFYAATKKAVEVVAHSYSHIHRTPITAFRFFTVYGPSGRPDMAPLKFLSAILKDKAIDVYGYGKMSRDFTYIDDLVEAIIRLSAIVPSEGNRVLKDGVTDTLSRQAPFRVVNIGGGKPVGLEDFISTIENATGRTAKRNMLPMQQGDMVSTFASPDLLKALTNYLPETSLDIGVEKLVEWYKKNQELFDE